MVQTASLLGTHRLVQHINCIQNRVVYGTVSGDMYLKDLLGSIERVGYCIMVTDFYLVTSMLKNTQSINHNYVLGTEVYTLKRACYNIHRKQT